MVALSKSLPCLMETGGKFICNEHEFRLPVIYCKRMEIGEWKREEPAVREYVHVLVSIYIICIIINIIAERRYSFFLLNFHSQVIRNYAVNNINTIYLHMHCENKYMQPPPASCPEHKLKLLINNLMFINIICD